MTQAVARMVVVGRPELGLDEMLVAHWLVRLIISSARLGSARLNFLRAEPTS
jgi:hypothetical protein